jgi:hypothetical protein
MKRTLFTLIAFALFVAVSGVSVASAQETPLRTAIEALVRTDGSPVRGVVFEPAAATRIANFKFTRELTASDVLEGLDELMAGTPFAWTLRSDRMVVVKLQEEAEPTVSEQAPPPDRPQTRQVTIPAIGVTQAGGDQESPFYMQRAIYGNGPVQPMLPVVTPYGAGAQAYGPVGYNLGNYGYENGFYNPFAFRDYANQEKYGLLKIDGPDRFLRSVRVVIDGRDASVASKANNAWNKPVLLTAGPHVVEFVREEKGKIQAFRRNIEIVPVSVQVTVFSRPAPIWLRVSGNEFDNAREVYEYRQHRYIERQQ